MQKMLKSAFIFYKISKLIDGFTENSHRAKKPVVAKETYSRVVSKQLKENLY